MYKILRIAENVTKNEKRQKLILTIVKIYILLTINVL